MLAAYSAACGYAWYAGSVATGLRVLFDLPLDLPSELPPTKLDDVPETVQTRHAQAILAAGDDYRERHTTAGKEHERLVAVYGAHFTDASYDDRIALVKEDLSSSHPATRKMTLFAGVFLHAHGLGAQVFAGASRNSRRLQMPSLPVKVARSSCQTDQ